MFWHYYIYCMDVLIHWSNTSYNWEQNRIFWSWVMTWYDMTQYLLSIQIQAIWALHTWFFCQWIHIHKTMYFIHSARVDIACILPSSFIQWNIIFKTPRGIIIQWKLLLCFSHQILHAKILLYPYPLYTNQI